MQKTALFTALVLLGLQPVAQVAPAKAAPAKQAAGSSDISIPFKKFQLPNGLTVLIHEDHSDPIVYVDVTFHVGSAREQQGRSGFAHFFEHMMFQGSKNVADEQHFKIITEAGGNLNGSTNTDRTNYFETVPSNQLEKMLWLEADRMGFLLDSVTQRKFEVQRATVKNERGQRYDNAPYGVVGEKIGEALYNIPGHPYSWTTIGYIEDLNRVDVNDLKRFYMRWYGPNNAVLTIAGDVNPEATMKLVQKYFGSIQRGPEVKLQSVAPIKMTDNRYISYEDNVKFPMLNIAYPTVGLKEKDDAALDVLANVLSGSQGSPLYKAFIESGKAASAAAYQFSRELAGQFQIVIRANPNTPLADVDKDLKQALADWEKKGVNDDDLVKFKAQYKSSLYNRLSTVQGKGAALASYYTLQGDAAYLKKDIERYMAVTKEDVMRVYETYIKNKPAVILSCLPKGKGDLRAAADNWKMPERKVEQESAEYKNLTFKEPKDVFNRAVMPVAAAAKPVQIGDFYKGTVGQVPYIGIADKELPKVNLLITFKAGHRSEPGDKSGLATLTGAMLEKSSIKTKAEEIENKLDRLGSVVNVNVGDEDINISIDALAENLDAVMKIAEESLFEPKFDKDEFENVKKRQLDGIMQAQTNAGALADMAFRKVLYGPEHVMSYPTNGTAETLNALTVNDVQEYYRKMLTMPVNVVITGALESAQVPAKLVFLSRLQPVTAAPAANEPAIPQIEKTKIYFVDKKNAAQSEIRIGYISQMYDPYGTFYKSSIMNFSFDGAFNSRVNYLLREIKGWTYGVRGGFSGSHYAGPFTLAGGFKSNTTDSTLTEIFNEFKKYTADGITDDELKFTKNAMIQSEALKYESPGQKLGFAKRMLDYNLTKDYVTMQVDVLNKIEKPEINELARRFLPYNNMVVIVVGDKASNFEKVKKLGFDVQEIDVNGKLLN